MNSGQQMSIACHPTSSRKTEVSLSNWAECWEHGPSLARANCKRAATEAPQVHGCLGSPSQPTYAIIRNLMVPGEGSLSSTAVLAACVSCWPHSLWMVSHVDRPQECFDWAFCLFEEESQLLSYFESFAGVLVIIQRQRVSYIFPVLRPKTSQQAHRYFLLLGCKLRTE